MNFSVIIPCYNCAATLETTVNSIRASGLTDYEILLIDDGSTDGTAAVCDRMSAEYPGIRCIHQENAGVSAARNRGIDEVQGDYIWFVDADDTVEPGSVKNAADIVSRQQPDMLIFGMSFDYYHKGKLYRRDELLPPYQGTLQLTQLKERIREFYNCNSLTTACNKFFRRAFLNHVSVRFHEGMILMEDFLFVLELLPRCEMICCLQEPVYHYRQAEDEKGAYRRLQKIPDIAAYLKPFEDAADNLQLSTDIVENLYQMLVQQKLYNSSLHETKLILKQYANTRYAVASVGTGALPLWLRNKRTQLRHKIAVAVKSGKLYQRYKARRNK